MTDAVHFFSANSQAFITGNIAVASPPRSLPGVERCILCKGTIPGNASAPACVQLCTQCAKTLEDSNEFSKVIAQCCECGALLNGVQKGQRPLTASGKPDLTVGNSHGICASCAVDKLAAHRAAGRRSRRQRQ